jgi:hypothetical protein
MLQKTDTLATHAGYAQWVPRSNVAVVAQQQERLLVWYAATTQPDRPTVMHIDGEVRDIVSEEVRRGGLQQLKLAGRAAY